MSRKSYKSVYYHIISQTKNREPFINENIQDHLYHFIFNKCKRLGLYLFKLGGIEDHIHILVYIPPKYPVAEIIGQIKGSSSYFINQELAGGDWLYWQKGYGLLTISEAAKPSVEKIYCESGGTS